MLSFISVYHAVLPRCGLSLTPNTVTTFRYEVYCQAFYRNSIKMDFKNIFIVFNKILYLDDVLLVTYTCTLRTLEGTCNKTGISFNVYTRNFTIDELNVNEETVTNTITKLAESAHLDSGDLVTTTSKFWLISVCYYILMH